MINTVGFEIASAGFFVILFFSDLVKKRLPTRRNCIFQFMMCFMMLAALFNIEADASVEYGESLMISIILQALAIFSEFMTLSFLHYYIMALSNRLTIRRNPVSIISPICVAVIGGCILSTPWTGLCFYFEVDETFHWQVLYYIFVTIILVTLVHDCIQLAIFCKEYSMKKRLLCIGLVVAYILRTILMVYHVPELQLLKVLNVFFMYAFYLSLQSPDFFVDNATGEFNRNGFFEVLQERWAYGEHTTCFLIRVRNYRAMNQIYGGENLRAVQRKIGDILSAKVDNRAIYHIGSSTFAVLLESKAQAKELYDAVKEDICEVWSIGRHIINQEYSYYYSSYPEDGESLNDMIQRIHYARSDHESHHQPGELIHLKDESVAHAEEKKEVAHLVEEAIMDNSIELHFQPIFSFEKKKITSLEVLARLKDRDKKYINPEFFIHVAEENHTIIPLGEQIFRKACIFASQNNIFDYGIEDININLSPAQCRYEGLTDRLVAIASEYGIPMQKMHLEITESEFTDKEAVERTLYRLKETGAKVALDDFGTGYSTLSNILELPVDYVKIDKSLVWSFADGKNQFLNDLMPMIKAEGKKIIAEGIETEDHIEIIKRLQGDYLQGYFYSKPLPEAEFVRFLQKFNGDHNYPDEKEDEKIKQVELA